MISTTIVATLPDPAYSKKFRKPYYCQSSEWEWGMGEDGELYCRDLSKLSMFTGEWFAVEKITLIMDMETIKKIARWTTSLNLKKKVRSLMDQQTISDLA